MCMSDSVMLCFVQGFDSGKDKNGNGKEPKLQLVKSKLLKKSRSSGSFGSVGSGSGSGNGSSGGTTTTTTTTTTSSSTNGCGSGSGAVTSHKGARSAPSTPHGVVALGSAGVALVAGAGASHEPLSQPTSPSPHHFTHLSRSPTHVFAKYDKGTLKQLSSSAPAMTAQARNPEPPSPKGAKADKMPSGTSKARQKKFHRHFTQVDDDERVLNYYSCALVGDILLQGHLYITKNYFAFYSNVFGYVTKLLIPISSVLKISKEKTARIIPNAVGVATADDKHVFGSLLSRDSTYKLMNMVLKAATNAAAEQTLPPPKDIRPGELDASEFSGEEDTSSQSGNEDTLRVPRHGVAIAPKAPIVATTIKKKTECDSISTPPIPETIPSPVIVPPPSTTVTEKPRSTSMPPLAKYNVFLLISTLLLLLLFVSAGVLLYRISRIQHRYMGIPGVNDLTYSQPSSAEIYNEILHWQSQLHSKSAGAVHNFLDSNLDQIAKVRKSLEALSTLLMPTTPVKRATTGATEHRSESPLEGNTPAPSPS